MALLPPPVTFGGALLLLGACASTTLQCIQGEGAVISSSVPQALTPPGCRVRGASVDGVSDLVCDGGRQGFLLDGAAVPGGAAAP
jgi:hypothetical protein